MPVSPPRSAARTHGAGPLPDSVRCACCQLMGSGKMPKSRPSSRGSSGGDRPGSSHGSDRPHSRGSDRPHSRGSDRPDSRGSVEGSDRPSSRQSQASYGMSEYDPEDDSSDESGSESEDDDDVEFQIKQVPVAQFNKRGFFGYCIFLGLFVYNTMWGGIAGSDAYYFADFCRGMTSKDDFWGISNSEEYYLWLGVHFFPSLAEYSVTVDDTEPFRLLSVPRIRQVRGTACAVPTRMTHIAETCYEWGVRTTEPLPASG